MRIFSAKCMSNVRLDGKTAVVTGSNTGIGRETVKDFFLRGARVIMACRNLERAHSAIEDIKNQCKNQQNLGELKFAELDLMSLASVRRCANDILTAEKRIDLLVNNAGVMMCPEGRTEDGFEIQFGTNHLGHFLFTLLLLPKICESAPARIVIVSSVAHKKGTIDFDDLNWQRRRYSALHAYQQSKLANVLFCRELAKRLEEDDAAIDITCLDWPADMPDLNPIDNLWANCETSLRKLAANIKGVNVYSLHPGVITTELGRHLDTTYFPGIRWTWKTFFSHFVKTPVQGAQTTIYCSVDEQCAEETGLYYAECARTNPAPQALNDQDAKRLWEESLVLVGLGKDFEILKQQSEF